MGEDSGEKWLVCDELMIRQRGIKLDRGERILLSLSIACILTSLACVGATHAATSQVHIIKYAADGTTVLNETTVDYLWLESHLPVRGNGMTHYYHQGPVFESAWEAAHPGEPYNMWDPEETVNYQEKDMGAVKGTDVRDICDLVGGMSEGELVKIVSSDGFFKTFPYENVYYPESRQGHITLTWFHGSWGYVPDYYEGMRIVFFSDTSTNPDGLHVFGIWDMHETIPEDYWHYFYGGSTLYPTTTGYTVKSVARVEILSDDPPAGSLTVTSFPAHATIYVDGEEAGHTNTTLDGLEPGSYEVSVHLDNYADPGPQSVEISPGSTSSIHFSLEPLVGNISVVSSPKGARIYLDGADTALVTDAMLDHVHAGIHTVTVFKSGYQEDSQSVNVRAGETANLSFTLIPTETGGGGSDSYLVGFGGGVLSLSESDAFHGGILTLIAQPKTSILTEGSSSSLSFEANLPDGASIRAARLFLYTWSEFDSFLLAQDPELDLRFQGTVIDPDKVYSDHLRDGSSETRVHTFCYKIEDLIGESGTYSSQIVNLGDSKNKWGIRGAALIIAYEDAAAPLIRWWLFEGSDAIKAEPYSAARSTGAEIEDMIDPRTIDTGKISIVSTGASGTMANHRILVNDLVVDHRFSKSASQIGQLSFSLPLDNLLRSGNRVEIESYPSSATAGDYLENRNMILVLTSLETEGEAFMGNESARLQEYITLEYQFLIPPTFSQPLIYGTGNGELTLIIEEKTNIRTGDGYPVEIITTQKINESQAFPDMDLIWLYSLSPENAIADKSIRLSIPLDICKETTQRAVLIRYNPMNGTWSDVPCSFSTGDCRITCTIDQLGLYGVIVDETAGDGADSSKETESTPLTAFLSLYALIFGCFMKKRRR